MGSEHVNNNKHGYFCEFFETRQGQVLNNRLHRAPHPRNLISCSFSGAMCRRRIRTMRRGSENTDRGPERPGRRHTTRAVGRHPAARRAQPATVLFVDGLAEQGGQALKRATP